jgi:hypothetical protein
MHVVQRLSFISTTVKTLKSHILIIMFTVQVMLTNEFYKKGVNLFICKLKFLTQTFKISANSIITVYTASNENLAYGGTSIHCF